MSRHKSVLLWRTPHTANRRIQLDRGTVPQCPTFGPSCPAFLSILDAHFDNCATSKFEDVLLDHGGLRRVISLAVLLDFFWLDK